MGTPNRFRAFPSLGFRVLGFRGCRSVTVSKHFRAWVGSPQDAHGEKPCIGRVADCHGGHRNASWGKILFWGFLMIVIV